jgi:hypothetical protein
MQTIPIHVASTETSSKTSESRRSRAQLMRYFHLAIGWFIALAPMTAAVFAIAVKHIGLGLGGEVSHALDNPWILGVAITALVVMMGHSVATCSSASWLYLMGAMALANFAPSLLIPGGIVAVALYVGLTISFKVYSALRVPHELPEACETRAELNPRCSTCHAKSFCIYQPGAIADRYTKS